MQYLFRSPSALMARPYVTRRTYQCMSLSVDAAEVVVADVGVLFWV